MQKIHETEGHSSLELRIIIPGVLNLIISRYVGQISATFPSNTKFLNYLILFALIFTIVQVSPLSIQRFEIFFTVTLKISCDVKLHT